MDGYGNHSLKAIKRLLPYLRQGYIYSEARQKAGYDYEPKKAKNLDKLGKVSVDTRNPIVNKGLHELRRVVNAVISEHGKPDAIRIEMARDLEANTKRRKEQIEQNKKNRKANDEAAEFWRKKPGKFSRDDLIKYRLWKDQDKTCPYSGNSICATQLRSAETEVDHILPYSKSLDDSYMNKVVCFIDENRVKGNKTPIDTWGNDTKEWDPIIQRIEKWKKRDKSLASKVDRFYKTEQDLQNRDGFINSQLNDTRYISREALSYIEDDLGCDVETTKGSIVAKLRHIWGLNSLLDVDDKKTKNRDDHRHHAVDAAVIACVNRRLHSDISRWMKAQEEKGNHNDEETLKLSPPCGDFRENLQELLDKVIVSHEVKRKISGALHEDTGEGYVEGLKALVSRKKVMDLKGLKTLKKVENVIKSVIDPSVREILKAHLDHHEGNFKEAFSKGNTVYQKDRKTPIHRVRVFKKRDIDAQELAKTKFDVHDKQDRVFKWLNYGNHHHVEVVRNKKGKYMGVLVTMMEASSRLHGVGKKKQSVVQKDHGADWDFVMALHIGDLVSVKDPDSSDRRRYYRVAELADVEADEKSFTGMKTLRVKLVPHNYAGTEKTHPTFLRKALNILMKKLSLKLHRVNAIGKLLHDQTDC